MNARTLITNTETDHAAVVVTGGLGKSLRDEGKNLVHLSYRKIFPYSVRSPKSSLLMLVHHTCEWIAGLLTFFMLIME